MTVSRILKTKGTAVITARPADTVASIAKTLASRRIGAVVILDGTEIAGIVSERDIVRAFAEHGGGASALTAAALRRGIAHSSPAAGLPGPDGEWHGSSAIRLPLRAPKICEVDVDSD